MSKLNRQRRSHSSLDSLPEAVKAKVDAMVIDDTYPEGFDEELKSGKPTYDDIVAYLEYAGHPRSRSAVGRYAARLMTIARMKQAGLVARDVMKDLTGEKASQTQKAAVEMITAHAIQLMAEAENVSTKDLFQIAAAMKDCANVAIKADQYIREQIKTKAEKASKEIEAVAKKKQIDPETLKIIKEQIYGIIG